MNRSPAAPKPVPFLTALACASIACAQAPHPSKTDLRFDRWYDYQDMTDALHQLAEAYPMLLTLESIGRSIEGRDIWLMTLNNAETGPDTAKAAMFIDGNIHGNEIQAAETVLYSIWYLTKSHGKIEKLTTLIDERAFYFVPMENPDGRERWFNYPANTGTLRSGVQPTDNDHDGLYDEDGYDDLDGDGYITTMWIRDPLGRYERDPEDDRFFRRVEREDPPGGWTRIGSEGIDNDGDGQLNEDGPGGYDPNRNWPSDWQPNHVQYGAGDYPFSLPETRCIGEFLVAHPNIAGFQSYHNSGGMILRGPAADYIRYPAADDRVARQIQETGAQILPYYGAFVTHEDLYTVHGGEKGFAYESLGIIAFTNELWTTRWIYMHDERMSDEDEKRFRELLQFDDVYVPYTEYEHPAYGTVLIGGTKNYSSRVTPPWILEEECHRNFAFTMYHADQMPRLEWGLLRIRSVGPDLWELTVQIRNTRLIPTILEIARQKRIGARDRLTCDTGPSARVVAAGTVSSLLPTATLEAVEDHPERIFNDRGIGGNSDILYRFLIAGQGQVELVYSGQKTADIRQTVTLEERGLEAP